MRTAAGWLLLIGAASVPVWAGGMSRGERELSHDDGRKDAERSIAGGGHVVRFERPSGDFALTGVRLHGSRYGGGYEPFWSLAHVRVRDEQWRVLREAFVPYDEWKPGRFEWVDVELEPTRVPDIFFVSVEYAPSQTRGIYQAIDEDGSGHSYHLHRGELGEALTQGEWMIRALGSKKELELEQPDRTSVETLVRGEGGMLAKQSMAGTGHAVLFDRPKDKPFVVGFSLYGQRYGGGYDPERTLLHVFVCDKRLRPLARTAFPYSRFGSGGMEWVDFELPAVEVPRSFALLVYFAPTATKGVHVGQWAEPKAASLKGLPERVAGKTERGRGWMIRAHCAASRGKSALPQLEAESDTESGPETGTAPEPSLGDALEIARLLEELDRAELEEDVDQASALTARLREAGAPEGQDVLETSEHFLLRSRNLDAATREALLAIMESAHDSLGRRFGVKRLSVVPMRRIHLHVTIEPGLETSLFTSPRSREYSLIVLRGDERALRAPTNGGPHVVYGFCHELGHVLMGWKDARHQWAHYLGSCVTSDVHAALGDAGWVDPYDYHTIEGLPRFEKEIADAQPGTGDDLAVARLFHEIGMRFGQRMFGSATAWIRANRPGEAFEAVRLYRLADLAAALKALGCEGTQVDALFGE